MRISFFTICLLVLLVACNAPADEQNTKFSAEERQEQETAMQRMMEVHDAVMPEMGAINRLSRDLKTQLENTQLETTMRDSVQTVIDRLENAGDGMMAWMNTMHNNSMDTLRVQKTHEEIMSFYRQEQQNIEQVKNDMLNSIEAGKGLLEKLQQQNED